jgi:hypothetical protein
MITVYVVIKDGINLYYLLKVAQHGFNIYCFPPHLGVHYSLHESGESHFRFEEKAAKPREELPAALFMGEAGTPIGKGIIRAPLGELGRASGICTAIFSIDSISHDFRKFDRSVGECFVIDKDFFPKDTSPVEIGVWAVPARNMASFEFNNPDIPADLLYKVAQCDPQIWTYARPR